MGLQQNQGNSEAGWTDLVLVKRAGWGAKEPLPETDPVSTPLSRVIMGWTDTQPCINQEQCFRSMKTLQSRDMSSGRLDIQYNFVVGGDGKVYEGRGWKTMPSFPDTVRDDNDILDESYHIGFMEFRNRRPPPIQMKALAALLSNGVVTNHLTAGAKVSMIKDDKIIVMDDYQKHEKEINEIMHKQGF